MTRLFVPVDLSPETELPLPPATAHRVREVLRARNGDALVLFDGKGGEYPATIQTCNRETVTVRLGPQLALERESPLQITLAQGIARGERMDYTLQKAVELGVTRIVPLATIRSQVKLTDERAGRRHLHWHAIVIHACEQCGRNRIPTLAPMTDVAAFAADDSAAMRLILSPGAPHDLRARIGQPSSFSLVIGPEGGLDPAEIAHLIAAGYQSVRLGPRVLRTETAALVALTTLQVLAGDLCLT